MITSLAAANLSMLKTNAYGTLVNACGALVFLCECPCVTSYMTVLIYFSSCFSVCLQSVHSIRLKTALVPLQKQAELSEQQVEDLLYLRRLYIHRRGALNLNREALVSKPYPSGSSLHPQQELDHVAELAAALKEIAMQDCKAYHLVSHAMCRGVSHLSVWGVCEALLSLYVCPQALISGQHLDEQRETCVLAMCISWHETSCGHGISCSVCMSTLDKYAVASTELLS